MSRKVKKVIGNKNFRIASICAAIVMFLGIVGVVAINAFGADKPTKAYYGEIDKDTGRGEFEDEYVLGTNIYNTTTHKFTVLEITPYSGYGELGYMVDNESGPVKLSDIQKLPNWEGSKVLSDWKQTVFSFLNTSGGWNHVSDDGYVEDEGDGKTIYEVDGKMYYDRNFFARGLTGTSYLSNKFQVIAKSATEVTVEDVKRADLVFISNGSHANTATTYNSMAAAAQASGNAELMAKYPVIYSNPTYSTTNDISKEVATAIVEHNVFNDKAVIFDKAAGNGSADQYIAKLYYLLLGIDSDDLREEFIAKEVSNKTIGGELVTSGYEGSMGYFDTDKFEIHFVGPQGWYASGFTMDDNGDWVFTQDVNGIWLNGRQYNIKAGEKIEDYGFSVDNNIKLDWNAGMFLYQIGQNILKHTDTNTRPYYYNANSDDQGYMNGSIYVFNGDCSLTQDIYGKASTGGGGHRDTDYDTAKEIYGDDITNNQIIEYLLGIYPHESQPPVKILEIQPAGFYEYSLADQSVVNRKVKDFETAIQLMYMIGGDTSVLTRKNYERKVIVNSISVNGYNGMTDDLKTEYDLIIVGTLSGDDGTDTSTVAYQEGLGGISINTDKRDNNLDGLIYTPIGDIFALKVAGSLPGGGKGLSDATKYYASRDSVGPGYTRMTGYDLTEKGYNKILEFATDKNMPVILADEIYEGNKSKIGSTTYVYKLSELAGRSNVLTFKEASLAHNFGLKEAFWNVCKKRAKINIYKPGGLEYDDYLVDKESDAYIIKPANSDNTVVQFTGNVRGAKETIYRYAIYVDKNGDGIYRTDNVVDDNNEVFASGLLRTDATGALIEMSGADVNEEGDFKLDVTLTDSMLGYFRWKMIVTEAVDDTTGVEGATDGAFIIRASEGTANKVVRVLQIIPDLSEERCTAGLSGGYSTYKTYKKALDSYPIRLLISSDYASKLGDETLLKNAKHFNELFEAAEEVTGIELEISTMTTTGYENLFLYDESGNRDTGRTYRDSDDYEDYDRNPLLNYDMVVIGFSDKYSLDTIGNAQGAVDLIKEFAGRGNAVLFAHDSMMYSNYSDGYKTAAFSEINYGGDVNCNTMVNILRSISGQDRYGVSDSIAGDTKQAADKDSAYWTSTKLPTIDVGNTNYGLRELGQLQGFTTNMLVRYAGSSKSKDTYNSLFNGISKDSISINNTTQATKLNTGQVTQYPYLIDDKLEISTTHGQWYQLDLEAKEDKSDEVVVWYALTSEDDSAVGKLYRATGVDAINDYYIYSKGSVTYSGAGHSAIDGDAEQKLFVNTIIRAITSANSIPVASFESAVVADEKRHLYTQYFREPIDKNDQSIVVTFKGTDDDLRKPESLTDTNAGQFREAFIYWDVNDNKIYNKDTDV
ncbi:MAG: DUF5057 domain-containing protein, partial [Lachnospiraceae bacterium]